MSVEQSAIDSTHPHDEALPPWFEGKDLVGSAVRHIKSVSPKFDWVGFYQLREKRLILDSYEGAPTPHTEIPVGRGVCGTAVAEKTDQNIPDVSKIENYLTCDARTRSELVVLVRDSKGKLVGQIDIDSHTENAFGLEEELRVREVAREVGSLWKEPENQK